MLLIKIFVELRAVAGRSRKRAGSPQAVSRRPCCAMTLRRTAWSEHGMGAAWAWHGRASVNQTRPHCVNQKGKTHSKHSAARHGKGTASLVSPTFSATSLISSLTVVISWSGLPEDSERFYFRIHGFSCV
jgi:hypothetical protein